MTRNARLLTGLGLIVIATGLTYLLRSNSAPIQWDMINVNATQKQGDAHLLRVNGQTILIDAGYYSEAKTHLVPFLNEQGVKKIDYFFISHPHQDHYEGAIAILEAGISITNLYYKQPAREVSDCCYSRSHLVWFMGKMVAHNVRTSQLKTGYFLDLGDNASLEVLYAQEGNLGDKKVDVNDLSMIMRFSAYGRTVLFTGDLNKTIGTFLSDDPRMKADIIKIPHHGGRSLAPNRFYDRVDPDIALVSGPEWVWCGKRGDQTRTWVTENRVPTWVNGTDGHVSITFEPKVVTISPPVPLRKCIDESEPEPIYPAYLKRN